MISTNIRLMYFSFFLALLMHALPVPQWTAAYMPDWVMLVLLYWCINARTLCNIGTAWILGLLIDTLDSSLLGQHALVYALCAYAVVFLNAHFNRRLSRSTNNALVVIIVLMASAVLNMWFYSFFYALDFHWTQVAYLATSMLVWPWVNEVLRFFQEKIEKKNQVLIDTG